MTRLFLANNANNLSASSSGLGVLTSDLESPVVSETSVGTHSLQALKILSELVIKLVDQKVRVLTVDNILLSVEEPSGDLVLLRGLDNGDDSLKLLDGELTSSLIEVDISLLADQVGVSATNTTDGGQGVHDLDLTIDVSREQTQNVLKVALLSDDKRHSVYCL